LAPEMSTPALTETIIKKVKEKTYDFIVANVACPDMVGHTGNLKATVKAVQAADQLFKEVINEVMSRYGAVLIVADHGNCEQMIDAHGQIDTAHTINPVPFIAVSRELMTSA